MAELFAVVEVHRRSDHPPILLKSLRAHATEPFLPAGRGMNRYHQWHGCRTYAENPRHRSLQRRRHCGHALGSARGGERTLIAVPLGSRGVGLLCAAGLCRHRARLGDPRGGWLVRLDLKGIRTSPRVSRRLALLGLEYPLLSHADTFARGISPRSETP